MNRLILAPLALLALGAPLSARGQAGQAAASLRSGLAIGAALPIFNPRHVTGPDRGTNTCPL